ncbi:MAG: hemerythrin domain-containing protein [Sulfuritalea sp.]|nr:hemerythrin domain-containing protein [Sulfuritalea sp.]
MKRHPDLQQLSREHHGALKLSRDARGAAESGNRNEVAVLARRVDQTFRGELDPHFCVEEQGILNLLAQAGQHALVARTLAEHGELRRLAESLATPDAETLLRFAELLGAHVRFEERELFEAAQELLAKSQALATVDSQDD